jgi:hypothetical protein
MEGAEHIEMSRTRRRIIWFALLGGASAWMSRFLVIWIISEFGCIGAAPAWGTGISTAVIMMLASLPFLAIAGYATWVSYGLTKTSVRHRKDRDNTHGFMARVGLITNPLFIAIMLVESMPMFFFLNECRAFSL